MADEFSPLVVRVPQACRMLSCSRQTLYNLLNEGVIVSFKEGKARKIAVASIEAYVKKRLTENTTFRRPSSPTKGST